MPALVLTVILGADHNQPWVCKSWEWNRNPTAFAFLLLFVYNFSISVSEGLPFWLQLRWWCFFTPIFGISAFSGIFPELRTHDILLYKQGGNAAVWNRLQFLQIKDLRCVSTAPNGAWPRLGPVVIAVRTKATAVMYGTEVIYLLFLYVLYLTRVFSTQTSSVPVYIPNSPQRVLLPLVTAFVIPGEELYCSHLRVCQ